MFYKYTQKKHDEYKARAVGNSLNPYTKILKSENTNIVALENMVYQTLYKLLNEVDIDLLDYNYRKTFDTLIRTSFDFDNPKYIWNGTTGNYELNSEYTKNPIKFRYTTEKCNLTKNNNSDIIKFKSNMTELEKVCNNYNDIIVRTMEKKIIKMNKMDERYKTDIKGDGIIHTLRRKFRSYIPDPFAGTNLNIVIRSYTVLGVTYSLVIGRYLIHSNEAQAIDDFVPREVYDVDALNIIKEFLKMSNDISKTIENTAGANVEELMTILDSSSVKDANKPTALEAAKFDLDMSEDVSKPLLGNK